MNFSEFKTAFQKTPVTEHPNKVSTKPKVSICVPTYNHKLYISKCLESILNQKTDFEFEILLGDDESTDGTEKICREFAQKFPDKIRLFSHKRMNNIKVDETSTGIFNALYSLYSANGEYIAYCDGDDYWGDKSKLQTQVDFLEKNPDYILTFHQVEYLNSKSKQTKLKRYEKDLSSEDLKKVIIQPLLISICFRNVIKDFPLGITQIINSDNFLTSLLGHYGKGKFLSSIKPAYYRIHRNGIWSLKSKEIQLQSKIKTFKVIFNFYKNNNDPNLCFFFKERTKNYKKMLVYYNIRHYNIFRTITNLVSLVSFTLK